MTERPLIPSAPTANRDSFFRDAQGNNAFRELDEPVVASLADASDASNPYASPRGPAMRGYGASDFVVSRSSRSGLASVTSILVLASVPLGWSGYAVTLGGILDFAWAGFIALWFFAGFVAASVMWTLARADMLAVTYGVIASVERGQIVRALWLARVASLVSLLSAAGIIALLTL